MNNVLIEPLPEEWNGYYVNTWFQVGIQIYTVNYDKELTEYEKTEILIALLFEDENGSIRPHPTGKDLEECVNWYLNGWFHDRVVGQVDKKRLVDYEIDQWRIYADFRQIYGINLNEADLHWWEFCGLLWNMPYKYSSFLQVIDIRKKKITSKMGKEEKKAIQDAKKVYALDQPTLRKEYTKEEEAQIDGFDRMMAEKKAKKAKLDRAVEIFRGGI